MNDMKRPVIGITLDWQESGSFSKRSHYALRDSYFNAVWEAGGMPVGLPLRAEAVADYVAMVDGVLVPGGDYPTPAEWYVEPHGDAVTNPRVEVDMAYLRAVLAADKPLLAICAGFQELVVACGGKLHWRVAEYIAKQGGRPAAHRTVAPDQVAHGLAVAAGTLLERVAGGRQIDVNSHHFEGAAEAGTAVVCGVAPDGVIEAIEVPGKRFALGVQWHPEFKLTAADEAILSAFVAAAGGR